MFIVRAVDRAKSLEITSRLSGFKAHKQILHHGDRVKIGNNPTDLKMHWTIADLVIREGFLELCVDERFDTVFEIDNDNSSWQKGIVSIFRGEVTPTEQQRKLGIGPDPSEEHTLKPGETAKIFLGNTALGDPCYIKVTYTSTLDT